MSERPTLAVGLMSGTSLDGVDAALVRFESPTHCTLIHFVSLPYSDQQRSQLRRGLVDAGPRELARLHVETAEWAGRAVEAALIGGHTKASALSFIAFPGQTIWHEPPTVTWQLGEPAVLAERFGVRVVSNFRSRDVAAGGQGAPLIPMADILLFGHPEQPRVLLNIGGMANLTYVPRRALEDGAFAFDTGPGVAIIDAVARLVDPSQPFDRDGRIARKGRVNERLLGELLSDPFFRAPPPKSTGRERFGDGYAKELHHRASGADGVATAAALTAASIAEAIRRWVPGGGELVVSGGGAHHPVLMEMLAGRLDQWKIRHFEEVFFSGDAKEAVAFALLGYLTIHGQPGNVPAATGARGPRVLGSITLP